MADGVAPPLEPREAVLARLLAGADVSEAALARGRQLAAATGVAVEQALNRLGLVTDEVLAKAYAEVLGLSLWRPAEFPCELDPDAGAVSGEFLRRHGVLPLKLDAGFLWVAAYDPLAEEAMRGLTFAFEAQLKVLVAPVSGLKEAFDIQFKTVEAPIAPRAAERAFRTEVDRIEDEHLTSDAVSIVTQAVGAAMRRRASDIHFEPRRHDLAVRIRVDGQLIGHRTLDRGHAEAVMTRLKVLAELDLGEKRLPQDGRATVVFEGRPVELRVSIVPTVQGESAVLRILDRNEMAARLEGLSLSAATQGVLSRAADSADGVFLVSGPTGSGKTTTLYAMLNRLKGGKQKILSVEDPVEYRFDHVVQVQAQPRIGLTFASALRAFLRQDPDVMLIGEIRDAETAEIAFQAAMTGHLVLASVHANDAVRVVSRLRDLALPSYQIAAALKGASAQRLVRRLCLACRAETPLSEDEQRWCDENDFNSRRAFRAEGCLACDQAGSVGRVAISEAFLTGSELTEAIGRDASPAELAAVAAAAGMVGMKVEALALVEAGEASLSDVRRALGS